MRTHSSSSNPVGESSLNPTTSNSKHRKRRRSKQPFIHKEYPVGTMADQHTMVELLRAPTEGYAEAIVVPPILAEHFELKRSLINMMTSDQFFRLEKDNPHDHIRWFNKITSTIKYKDVPNSQTSAVTTAMTAILKQFQATPPPTFVKAVEEICITCDGTHPYYQCLAADGNTFLEFWDNIQGYVSTAAVNYNQDNFAPIQQNHVVPLSELEKIKKMNEINMKAMQTQINNVKNELGNEIKTSIQASMSNQTNELKNMMASFFQMNSASTSRSGPLPSNTISNPKGELKAVTTRSGLVLDRPFIPMPPAFINPEEDERVEETLTDPNLVEYTIKVPPPLQEKDEVQIHKFWKMFKQLHINITLADDLILIPKYQKMLKALLFNKEKLLELANTPLNENCSAIILKKLPEKLRDFRKFLIPCGFSELKCKALADLGASINLMPLSVWKKLVLPELIFTRITLELANRAICTPTEIARDVFVPVGKFTFPADFVIVDYESDPRVPLVLGRPFLRTARALIDVYIEEMILRDGDERLTLNMRHDTSSYSNQPQKESINMINIFDDLCEDYLEDLFEMDSILEDLIDESNLASPNDNLFVTIPDMFTDKHALDYSSPPIYDDFDDDLDEFESDNDDVYNVPFDSKGEKIKESKLLIDELDLPRSSDFLPVLEYDSFIFKDYSKVDALPSTNNEDKVFNPGILIHENLSEVITRVALDKNEKKIAISHASLIIEDFDPPFSDHELLSTKKFLGLKLYSRFHLKMRKKFSNPGFSLLKDFILLFSRNYLIGALKFLNSLKFVKARWRFFLALLERTSISWMFRVFISIPHEQFNLGFGSS
uniref:Reverse transcriptase domain-containing protein n=1 Tax=Tanacetum cinerariifolium TaxID=118510 RepID=A0A699ITQ8_TANCI|nr:hypothetical protein [Tanacetum cinerariifolium]